MPTAYKYTTYTLYCQASRFIFLCKEKKTVSVQIVNGQSYHSSQRHFYSILFVLLSVYSAKPFNRWIGGGKAKQNYGSVIMKTSYCVAIDVDVVVGVERVLLTTQKFLYTFIQWIAHGACNLK